MLEVLEANHNRRPLSLDRPVGGDEDESPASEWVGDEDEGFELVEDKLALEGVLPHLDERERLVLQLRFVEDMTQSQIAERIGHSQMHVSRILRRTLERIRAEVAEQDGDSDGERLSGERGDADDEELAVVVLLDPQLVGQRLQRAADLGQVEAGAQPLGAAALHRADPQLDALLAVGDAERDVAVAEALRGAGGDRVAEQHRVGEAVDGDLAAGGEGAEGAAEDRRDQLRVADPHLGLLGGAAATAVLARRVLVASRAASGRCMRISVPRSTPPLISKLLERAAIRVRPIRRLGRSTSGRGRIPIP